jgi:hypothetical protein
VSTLAASAQYIASICPVAPPGVQQYSDEITAWVKWGVLAMVGIAAFVSVGALVGGRIMHNPQGARYGAMGLVVSVIAAVLYVTIYAIITGITGAGC